MIHIIKKYKWVIATSLICILFGILTFFTFINQSSIELKDSNQLKATIQQIRSLADVIDIARTGLS